MSETRQAQVSATSALLVERGIADADFMHRHTPADVLAACNAWAVRVGVTVRGVGAVRIVTSGRYPGLIKKLLGEDADEPA